MSRGFTEKSITRLLKFLGAISIPLSISKRTSFGKKIGKALQLLSRKRYEITLENISLAFSEKSITWHRRVARESYENLGITLAELLALPALTDEKVAEYIKYENIELLKEMHSRGRGMLLLSGHFGNWELLAYSAGLFTNIPITIVVKPQQNEYADELLNKYRTQRGNGIISMHGAARVIIQKIRKGEAIALLADQSATGDKDIFIEYFGRPAATYETPAALALRFKIPIVIGFAVRQRDNTYRVRLHEILYNDLEDTPEGVRELTRRHVKMLEDAVRERPELWSWQHRRWKHAPPAINDISS